MSTNKFTRVSKKVAKYSLVWGLLYMAFIQSNEGAYNLVHVLAWIIIPLLMLGVLICDEDDLREVKINIHGYLFKIDKLDDALVSICFIWFGSIATGICWGAASILITSKLIEAKKGHIEHE